MTHPCTVALLLAVLVGSFASRAAAEAEKPLVPSVSIELLLAFDTASATSGYHAGSGAGVGFQAGMSFIQLLTHSSPTGLFIRDQWTLSAIAGPLFGQANDPDDANADLFGRAFFGVGLKVGVGSADSVFYLHPRVFTGFDTVRAPLASGSGAGRAAWLVGAGTSFGSFGIELAYGRGGDTGSDTHSVVDLQGFLHVGDTFGLPYAVFQYQGVFGDIVAEHDLTAGLGMRF